MRTHLRRDVAQKSCPTSNRGQLRVLLYRGRKIGYILSILQLRALLKTGLWSGHFFGRRRAEDVFAFHEFFIVFVLVFCKLPEIIKIQRFQRDCSMKVNTVKTGTIRNYKIVKKRLTVEWVQLTERPPHVTTK